MPKAIWIIGFGIFAQGTSELMLAGLLPEMSADLDISVSKAGWLISAFALGMLIGAPTLAVLTLRWPRRRALVLFVSVFILSHIAGALSGNFFVLLALRFIGAFVYAGFWAVGGATAMSLAGPEQRGRAMGIVAGGLTVATVVGLPAGTWIGQLFGWRSAFWSVAALSLLALIAISSSLPALRTDTPPSVRSEIRGLHQPRLWLSYAMTASATAALIATFSYLAAMLIDTTGLAAAWVPAVLVGYGVGALLGIVAGGQAADRFPRGVFLIGFTGLLATSAALGFLARSTVPAIVLIVLLGALGFFTNPALNSRIVAIAPDAPTLAVSGNTSAFNAGIALGPWIGGLLLTTGQPFTAIPIAGAVLASVALSIFGVDQLVRRRAAPTADLSEQPIVSSPVRPTSENVDAPTIPCP